MLLHMVKLASCLRNPATRKCITSFHQRKFLRLEPVTNTYETRLPETFEEKNERLKRPLSPHITIYKFPFPAILSICHRISGLMLVGYAAAVGWCGWYSNIVEVVTFIQGLNLSDTTWMVTKCVLSLPFAYHLANGARHLFWDTGYGLSMTAVYVTGYLMLVGTMVISICLLFE